MADSADEGFYHAAVNAIFLMAAATAVPACWIKAPYGRYARSGWGPSLPPTLAWLLMESPALLLPFLLFPYGRMARSDYFTAIVVMAPFVIHYFQRTLIYPLRIPRGANPVPAVVAFLAFIFNVYNGYLQARWVTHYGSYSTSWLLDLRFITGVLVFAVGMFINIWADSVLLSLRKDKRSDTLKKGQRYQIPKGGLFEFVSCPNYFGEIVEWLGWAILTWSRAGLGFFVYTVANLGPRAAAHHDWYREKFGSAYPKSRNILIPFLV